MCVFTVMLQQLGSDSTYAGGAFPCVKTLSTGYLSLKFQDNILHAVYFVDNILDNTSLLSHLRLGFQCFSCLTS